MKLCPLTFRRLAIPAILASLFAAAILVSVSTDEARKNPGQSPVSQPFSSTRSATRSSGNTPVNAPAAVTRTAAEETARRLATQPVTEENRHNFCAAMTEWATAAPVAALTWWHDEAQDVAQAAGLEVDEQFYATSFTALSKLDLPAALASVRAPDRAESRLVALEALARTASAQGRMPWLMDNPPTDGEWTPAERVVLLLAAGAAAEANHTAAALPAGHEAAWLGAHLPKPDGTAEDHTDFATNAP